MTGPKHENKGISGGTAEAAPRQDEPEKPTGTHAQAPRQRHAQGPEGCPTEPFPHPEDWHHAWIRPVFWLAFVLPRAFPCKFMHSGVIWRTAAGAAPEWLIASTSPASRLTRASKTTAGT